MTKSKNRLSPIILGTMAVFLLMAAGLLLTAVAPASAATVTATITADNHYALYYGDANGNNLTLVGRNEDSVSGSPGQYNWSLPETWATNMTIFVLAWDDGGPQSWIGDFTLPGNQKLYSNLTEWQYIVASGPNPGGPPAVNFPSLATVQNDIATGVWATPLASAPNGSAPWGTISGISGSANFIWHDTLGNNSTSDAHYAIYRAVPLPPSCPAPGQRPAGAGGPGLEKKENQLNQFTGNNPAPRLLPARGFLFGPRPAGP